MRENLDGTSEIKADGVGSRDDLASKRLLLILSRWTFNEPSIECVASFCAANWGAGIAIVVS